MPENDYRARLNRLQGAADDAARVVRNVYLTFLLVSLYVALIVGATTDEQLLRVSDVRLPLLNVGLPIIAVYFLVPFLYLVLHFNLLLQIYLLSRKLFTLDAAIDRLPAGFNKAEQRNLLYPLPIAHRLLPGWHQRSTRWLFGVVVLLTVVILPIAILGGVQLRFLPYHSETMTWWHRAIVMLDLLLAWVFWPIIVTRQGGWSAWFMGIVGLKTDSRGHRAAVAANAIPTLLMLVISGYLAVVPGRSIENHTPRIDLAWVLDELDKCKRMPAADSPLTCVVFGLLEEDLAASWKFLRAVTGRLDMSDILMRRNLRLREKTLVEEAPPPEVIAVYAAKKWPLDEAWKDHARGLDLSERDLRFADFRKARVFADFRGADLDGAVFIEADVRLANFAPFELPGQDPRPTKLNGAFFRSAKLQGANLRGAELQGADLVEAQLQDADLIEARLQGADLTVARLQGADLRAASLQGADLTQAQLQGADLSLHLDLAVQTQLQGADLSGALLQGADLRWAELQGADLSRAELQGANLGWAELQGADLSMAELQGADLRGAGLQGTDLREAQLQGADLRFAQLWKADFANAKLDLTDMRGVDLLAVDQARRDELFKSLAFIISDEKLLEKVREWLRTRFENDVPNNTLHRAQKPRKLIYVPEEVGDIPGWPMPLDEAEYSKKLAPFLIDLACGDEHTANGIARQVVPSSYKYTSYALRVHDTAVAEGLLADGCEARAKIPEAMRAELREIAGPAEQSGQ